MDSGEGNRITESDPTDNLEADLDENGLMPMDYSDYEIEIGFDDDDDDDDDNDDDYEDEDDLDVDSDYEGVMADGEQYINDVDLHSVDENMSNDSSSESEPDVSSSDNDENSSGPPARLSQRGISAALQIISRATAMINEESQSALENTSETTNDDNDIHEEAFSCSICLEGLTNTGSHRPACLKCGHIFGEKCLERWIKVGCNNEARRCPTCNTKASLKDIRVLYAKQLTAIDTAELTAMEIKLDLEQRDKNRILAEVEKYKVKNQHLTAENERLKSIIENTKSVLPSTSGPTTFRQCLKKINLCKKPGCRVMTFNKNTMMLAVGQHSDSQLFTNSHVIRKLNASILEPSNECIYAHSKQIRDMTFHPNETNLLASVSLDKFIKLIDMGSNTVVSHLNVGEPLWSCCWAGDNPNILTAGSQMGSVYYVDRRFMKLLDTQQEHKFGCVSLIPLPPSNSRSFINGGFIKTRMDAIYVCEHNVGHDPPNYTNTQLPLKGLWSSSSYDSQSNLILSSSKPCGDNKSVRHIVSKMADFNVEGPLIYPVATFFGGDKATQLFRSCIIPANGLSEDTMVCSYDEKSNYVKLFSINSGNNVHNFHVKENILDLCPLNGIVMNSRRVVAGLSENSISIFSV